MSISIWKFNEGTGITAADSMYYSNLTATGSPAWDSSTQKLGASCTVLNGTSQYWTGADLAGFEPGTNLMTFCAWVWVDSAGNGTVRFLFSKQANGAATDRLCFYLETTNTLRLQCGSTFPAAAPTTVPTNQWVFVWFRRNNGGVCTMGFTPASTPTFNKTPDFTFTDAASSGVNTSALSIGALTGLGTLLWRGKIDQVYFNSNACLSMEDLEYYFNGGVGTENLIVRKHSEWRFDEVSGTTSADSNALHKLYAIGTPTFGPGRVGNATYLDGTTSCWRIDDHEDTKIGMGDFSIAGWVWANRAGGNPQLFINKARYGTVNNYLGMSIEGTGMFAAYLGTVGYPESPAIKGGTVTYSGGYTIHTFTSTGVLQVDSSANGKVVEYLIIGGGGGGGHAEPNPGGDGAGGGGAGGFVTGFTTLSAGTKTVTVGLGGAGDLWQTQSSDGRDSEFNGIYARGGGGGGSDDSQRVAGNPGGSGGGACNTYGTNNYGGLAKLPAQGFKGGDAVTANTTSRGGSGGGGASAAGQERPSTVGGAGGAGLASSISGGSVTYCGGGGGGGCATTGGAGGTGGGGAGGASAGNGTAGTNGLGGGGGGGGSNGGHGANGGSGIVIIRYANDLTFPIGQWVYIWLRRKAGSVEAGYSSANQFEIPGLNYSKGIWEFNESSGTTAYDTAVKLYNLTAIGSPTFTSGKLGNCTVLTGSDSWTASDHTDFEPGTGDFTFCCWVKQPTSWSYVPYMFVKTTSGSDPTGFGMGINPGLGNDKLMFWHGSGGAINGTTNVPTGKWVFCWAKRSGTTLTIGFTPEDVPTFNTTPEATVVTSTSLGINAANFQIGWNGFAGQMDQCVWIKDYALTDSDLAWIFNSGTGRTLTNTPVFNKYPRISYSNYENIGITDADFSIGGQQNASGAGYRADRFLDGRFDQFIFSRSVLTDTDLTTMFNNGLGTTTVPSHNTLSLWTFNEGNSYEALNSSNYSINNSYDSIAERNLVAIAGPVTISGGKFGYAIQGSCYTYPDDVMFQIGTGDFTFCGWANVASLPGMSQWLFSKATVGDTTDLAHFGIASNNQFHAEFGTHNTDEGVTFPYVNNWVFFWVRRTSGLLEAGYTPGFVKTFDEVAKISYVDATSIGVNSANFMIGRDNNGGTFGGRMDQFMWSKGYAFTNQELRGLFNKGLGTEYLTMPQSIWQFNEYSGTIAYDNA